MRQHQVKPETRLHFLRDMSEIDGRDALYGLFLSSEGLEERDDTLGNAGLLPLLMDVCPLGVEKHDLRIRVLFLLRLGTLGLQTRVNYEKGAYLDPPYDIR